MGQGRRSKALAEKLAAGNPGHRPMLVMDLPEGAQLDGEDMPEPGEYLKARQRNGGMLEAEKIYRETWRWLKDPLKSYILWYFYIWFLYGILTVKRYKANL